MVEEVLLCSSHSSMVKEEGLLSVEVDSSINSWGYRSYNRNCGGSSSNDQALK